MKQDFWMICQWVAPTMLVEWFIIFTHCRRYVCVCVFEERIPQSRHMPDPALIIMCLFSRGAECVIQSLFPLWTPLSWTAWIVLCVPEDIIHSTLHLHTYHSHGEKELHRASLFLLVIIKCAPAATLIQGNLPFSGGIGKKLAQCQHSHLVGKPQHQHYLIKSHKLPAPVQARIQVSNH